MSICSLCVHMPMMYVHVCMLYSVSSLCVFLYNHWARSCLSRSVHNIYDVCMYYHFHFIKVTFIILYCISNVIFLLRIYLNKPLVVAPAYILQFVFVRCCLNLFVLCILCLLCCL